VARVTGRDIAPLERPLTSMAEMHVWINRRFGSVFAGSEGRLKAFEAAFVQARFDGVTRLEVGEDIWAVTLFDHDAALLTSRLAEIHARVAPCIEWIPQLGMSRHCPVANLTNWLQPFLELDIYRTLDLSGDELCQLG
jgi:adenosine deaminase